MVDSWTVTSLASRFTVLPYESNNVIDTTGRSGSLNSPTTALVGAIENVLVPSETVLGTMVTVPTRVETVAPST